MSNCADSLLEEGTGTHVAKLNSLDLNVQFLGAIGASQSIMYYRSGRLHPLGRDHCLVLKRLHGGCIEARVGRAIHT